jgi:hypothetical protein
LISRIFGGSAQMRMHLNVNVDKAARQFVGRISDSVIRRSIVGAIRRR